MNKKERQIIEQAYFHLKNELGDAVRWNENHNAHDSQIDAFFKLNDKKLAVLFKNEVRPAQVSGLSEFAEAFTPLLVVANYITPTAKKVLQEHGINYVDRVGNIWLKIHPIYIHIDGIHNQPPSEDQKNRAFTKTGIKVVFQFLLNPKLINGTYREMAEIAGVSLGSIPKVMEGLKEEGFILKKTSDQWAIKDVDLLLQRWQNEYTKKLKPSLFVKRYRSNDNNFFNSWKRLNFSEDTFWGGEPAGDLLTKHLQPEKFVVYSRETHQNLMKNYQWFPDENGDIYVFEPFWENLPETNTPEHCVPPILAYADLMESGDGRCVEIAKLIYEQYL
ncbi:MAG: hypothetical protein JJT77_10605 [Crocinitomicaceae bacterium]|nr:hypothetical protein [Crocinitomicaceae bacterium]